MTEPCFFCDGPVNPHDLGTWKQVVGWVGGPRKDAMTLREDTGKYAHDSCVAKARGGQTADQPELLSQYPQDPPDTSWVTEVDITDTKKDLDKLEGLIGKADNG